MTTIDISKQGVSGIFNVNAYCNAFNLKAINITKLDCSHNNITEISGIQFLKNLEEVNCEMNNIKDISFIRDLKKLKYINLSYNKYSLDSARKLINELPIIECFDIRKR